MDRREQLVDLIKQEAEITDKDKIIINAFKLITDYLEPVEKELEHSNLDNSEYKILTGQIGAAIKVSDKNLYFYDRNDYIQLEYFDNNVHKEDYDKLVISGNHLKSMKYDIPLSNELLDKYLELFF